VLPIGVGGSVMSQRLLSASLRVIAVLTVIVGVSPASADPLRFCCREDNDLFQAATASGIDTIRVASPRDAITGVAAGSGVLVLADDYPGQTTAIDDAPFAANAKKQLRLYVEYPATLPLLKVGAPRGTHWERAIVASNLFAPDVDPLPILAIHACRVVPVAAAQPHLVVGFGRAVYGIPKPAFQILFDLPSEEGREKIARDLLPHVLCRKSKIILPPQ
jgi:hypothetical protein